MRGGHPGVWGAAGGVFSFRGPQVIVEVPAGMSGGESAPDAGRFALFAAYLVMGRVHHAAR